jgi:hypothetical protein
LFNRFLLSFLPVLFLHFFIFLPINQHLQREERDFNRLLVRPISTRENFTQKENFVKCDWPTHDWKISTFNNDIFGKLSVRTIGWSGKRT